MARMLTTDMFLTAFNTWAIYFFWRSWLVGVEVTRLTSKSESEIKSQPPYVGSCSSKGNFFGWHLAGWGAVALGFLTKGPIGLAIPLVALATLAIYRWKSFAAKKLLCGGLAAGCCFFWGSGTALVPGGFPACARVVSLHDFWPGSGTFARDHHQGPPGQPVLFLRYSRRRTFAVDCSARLAVAPGALARPGSEIKGRLDSAQHDCHFHLRAVFSFTGQVTPLYPANFSSTGGDAGLAVFRRCTGGQTRAGVGLAVLSGQFIAVAGGFSVGRGLCFPQYVARMDEMADAGRRGNDSFRLMADAKMETLCLRHACHRTGVIEFGNDGG